VTSGSAVGGSTVGEPAVAGFTDDDEARLVAEVRAVLADPVAEAGGVGAAVVGEPGLRGMDHADLGYGFGGWSRSFLRQAGARGWISLLWPAGLGGAALPPRALWVLLHELAYGGAPAEALFYSLAVGQCLVDFATPELQRELLPKVAAGEVAFSEALSEPDAGSDLLSLRTFARRDGDHYVVNGQKVWTSNGAISDMAMVIVRTSTEGPRGRAISTLIIDLDAPGVTRRAIPDITGEPSYAELFFDDVVVPATSLLGTEGGGMAQVLAALEWDRFWARSVKAPFLRRELDDLVAFLKGASAWDDESVRLAVAELAVDIEVCDALFADALDRYGVPGADLSADAAAGKTFADALGLRFYEMAEDVLGLAGALSPARPDAPLGGRLWRNGLCAHGLRIAGGTPEVQESTVATRGLGLPRARS